MVQHEGNKEERKTKKEKDEEELEKEEDDVNVPVKSTVKFHGRHPFNDTTREILYVSTSSV